MKNDEVISLSGLPPLPDIPPFVETIEVPELTKAQRFKLWNAVINAIESEGGNHYDQDRWSLDFDCEGDADDILLIQGSCGTRACIAGHAVHEAVGMKILRPFRTSVDFLDYVVNPIYEAAQKLLGLSRVGSRRLFAGSYAPDEGLTVADNLREIRDAQLAGESEDSVANRIHQASSV